MSNLDRFLASFANLEVAWRYLPRIAEGMLVTLGLGLAVIGAGVVAGLALAVLRALRVPFTGWLIVAFADVFRALPPLVIIIVLFFAFPYIDLPMSAFVATWLSLSLVLAAFAEEVFWAGILSVPREQWSAGLSLGLTRARTLFHVVLPQAIRLTVPPLTNRVISITKGTALGSVVALHEILNVSSSASSEAGNPTPLTLGALAYLVLFIPFVWFGRRMERRFAWKR
ncbi:MAG: amino acid ABC transporter permease [Burkholderiales bacterium]|nr:amino acid ABC transporter permease [Burkholderiales bacterium]